MTQSGRIVIPVTGERTPGTDWRTQRTGETEKLKARIAHLEEEGRIKDHRIADLERRLAESQQFCAYLEGTASEEDLRGW